MKRSGVLVLVMVAVVLGVMAAARLYPAEAAPCLEGSFREGGKVNSCSSASVTYTMSHANSNYNDGYANNYENWGYYALRWKAHARNITNYQPWNALPPSSWVDSFDDDELDAIEADTCVFPSGNPSGGWDDFSSFDFKELFVGAAIYLDLWQSPVFANLDVTGDGFDEPVVIKSITFNITDPFGATTMGELCDFWGWNQIASGQYTISQVASACSFHEDADYSITSVTFARWNPSLGNHTVSGESAIGNTYVFGSSSVYIGDPVTAAAEIFGEGLTPTAACGSPQE